MGSVNSARKNILLPHPVVDTEYGPVEGKKVILPEKKIANVFLGIPFAKPPVRELRFQKPIKPDPWSTPLNCHKYRSMSIQKKIPVYGILSSCSEDCLYLNIVVPAWCSAPKNGFPVMMYIHGGGFVMDSGVTYTYKKVGRTLVRHGVIVVTTTYRLGPLGFFCTNDNTSIGNYGIWDQFFALKFVYDNIAKFGGDPENITLFGQSAGGVSADLLSILPISRDMVKKVGVLGGNCETIWATYTRASMAKQCQTLAIKLGFKKTSETFTKSENSRMLEYLNSLPGSAFGKILYFCKYNYFIQD